MKEVFHTSPIKGHFDDIESAVEFAEQLSGGDTSRSEFNRYSRLWSFNQWFPKISALSLREARRKVGLPICLSN
jgi:hypothetical protein